MLSPLYYLKDMKMNTEKAIATIKQAYELSKKTNKPLFLAFSGGKDSCVLLDLAKKSGVKFSPVMAITSLDPPEVIRFVLTHYPDVQMMPPKKSVFRIAQEKKCLPMRQIRWCCELLKEKIGFGGIVLTGVRKEESKKRQKRKTFEKFKGSRFVLGEYELTDIQASCINGKEKIIVNPLLDWSEKDVFNYLKKNNVAYPKDLYKFNKRLGCIGCPLATKKQRIFELQKYPFVLKRWRKTIDEIKKNRKIGIWKYSTDDIIEWWLTGEKDFNKLFNIKTILDDGGFNG